MSKMKQYLEKQIVIKGKEHEETGWKRYIYFEYEGNEYELTLFYDEFTGYDTYWRVPNTTLTVAFTTVTGAVFTFSVLPIFPAAGGAAPHHK